MDEWFRTKAMRMQDENRVAVHCCTDNDNRILGFFALTGGTIEVGDLSTRMRGNKVGSSPPYC